MFKSVKISLKKLVGIFIVIFAIYANIATILDFTITKKIDFNQLEAKKILKETYQPLEEFIQGLKVAEDGKLLVVQNAIRNEKDFTELFTRMGDQKAKMIYNDLVEEKKGQRYVAPTLYIPDIYDKNAEITAAYIKKRKSLRSILLPDQVEEREELVIAEKWIISGERQSRKNYFRKNQDGEWILENTSGIGWYKFINIQDNPWSIYWRI